MANSYNMTNKNKKIIHFNKFIANYNIKIEPHTKMCANMWF